MDAFFSFRNDFIVHFGIYTISMWTNWTGVDGVDLLEQMLKYAPCERMYLHHFEFPISPKEVKILKKKNVKWLKRLRFRYDLVVHIVKILFHRSCRRGLDHKYFNDLDHSTLPNIPNDDTDMI